MPRPWQGIVRDSGMTAQQFDAYVAALPLRDWVPDFCVVHNTGIPLFSQWHRVPGPARMRALESYYRDDQKWSAGPHLFVADDFIWPFTPLYTQGVHAPSWNSVAWGVELVGDFNREEVPAALLANAVAALATLHRKASIVPSTIHFHREDPLTTHKVCPGSNLSKPDLIAAVERAMGLVAVPSTSFPVLRLGARGPDVARLQQLLGMDNLGAGAGIFGPKTQAAVIAFQKSHGLVADGIVGGSTWRSLA
jgi:hypothetical protein